MGWVNKRSLVKVPGSRAWHRGIAINRLLGNFTGNSWRARWGRAERERQGRGEKGRRERNGGGERRERWREGW